MIRKYLCCILSLLLLLSVFPLSVRAAEEAEVFIGEPPKVEISSSEGTIIGQSKAVLWSARSVAAEYPNNPPADVDTVEEKVDWIAQKCRETGLTDDWDIALWLHDWLIYNANYDYSFTYYYPEGVLLKGTGVCQSYAMAYELLLDEFSIENMLLTAPEMNHAWNLVKIDGEWCHVDCTWDDPGEGGHECHTYFGMTDKMIGADHVWNTSRYPACTSKMNYHPIRMGYLVFETVEEMMEILDREATAKNMVLELYYIGGDPNFRIMDHYRLWLETNMSKYQINGWGGGWYTETWLQTSLYYWGVSVDHIHDYREEVTSPTCTEDGYTIRRCSCDGYYIDSYVDALGHSFKNYISNDDATCTEDGTKTGKCERCGMTDTTVDAGTAMGHTFGEWVVVIEPTCIEKGERQRICATCGDRETEEVVALDHNYESLVTKPTCEGEGYTTHICDLCGDSYIDSYVDALAHEFEEGRCIHCSKTEKPETPKIPGDIDGNENVDVDDVLALLWNVLFPDDYPINAEADFDGNGVVDVDDVLALLWHVLFPDDYPI